ncbi:MAG: hypothetical protein C4320_08840 [Armatimonadota bacterium]
MNPSVDRRTVLKGIGTLMALPALESLPVRALAASAPVTPPIRMAYLFVPNGVNMSLWTPEAESLAAGGLPQILTPLEKLRGDVSVLTGLAQNNAFALGDGPGDHARSSAAFLTGVHARKTSGSDIKNGVSVDQIAAREIGGKTRFASLELGCERGGTAGDCDSGYSCAYSSAISWKSENTPMAKEVNPRLVFERLFGNGDKNEQKESLARRDLFKKSILDFVAEDASFLKARLGARDARKLDEYFQSVREIETRLVKFENSAAAEIAAGIGRPGGIPAEYGEHLRLIGDMMILAFQADLTRVSTFMFANDGSNRSYAQIGIPEGHHDVSHHGQLEEKLAKKARIDTYHVEQLAYILNKMKSIKESNGSLLDNTMLIYGAGISDGDKHNHDDLPLLLAGGRNAGTKLGHHLKFEHGTPLNNLFMSMLNGVGVKVEKFGDANGNLRGIF